MGQAGDKGSNRGTLRAHVAAPALSDPEEIQLTRTRWHCVRKHPHPGSAQQSCLRPGCHLAGARCGCCCRAHTQAQMPTLEYTWCSLGCPGQPGTTTCSCCPPVAVGVSARVCSQSAVHHMPAPAGRAALAASEAAGGAYPPPLTVRGPVWVLHPRISEHGTLSSSASGMILALSAAAAAAAVVIKYRTHTISCAAMPCELLRALVLVQGVQQLQQQGGQSAKTRVTPAVCNLNIMAHVESVNVVTRARFDGLWWMFSELSCGTAGSRSKEHCAALVHSAAARKMLASFCLSANGGCKDPLAHYSWA